MLAFASFGSFGSKCPILVKDLYKDEKSCQDWVVVLEVLKGGFGI